ncbi:MAG TPA: EAL domain-containing protein [Burkholderiales bacterium]|nr:EAL domain-containing protein [Burkholderiales bacterium]
MGGSKSSQAWGQADERLQGLLALSSDIYWEQDTEYRFTHFSGSPTAMVEALRARSLGKYRWDQQFFNMGPAEWAAHRALLDERRAFRDLECCRIDESGRMTWISVSGEPVFDAQGRFAGYRGLGKDISLQKLEQALVALEHSVARALATAETIGVGLRSVLRAICELQGWPVGRYFSADDAAGVLRFAEGWAVNDAGARAYLEQSRDVVYRRGEGISGHAWVTREPLWVGDVATDARASSHARMWGGQIARRGALAIPVDVGERTIGVFGFASTDRREPEERLLRSLKVIGDQVGQFLQRKQADAALRESEERYRRTFELAGSGISHIGLDRRFIRVNRRLCEILGYAENELIGMTGREISHPDDLDIINAQRPKLYSGEMDRVHIEKRYVRKDGSIVWVNLTVALARGPQGEPQHEITIFEDVTARKQAEREREAAEKALRESEERRARHLRRQERIARFGQEALAQRDAGELVQQAVQTVLEALGAEAVAYLEPAAHGDEFMLRAIVGVADASAHPGVYRGNKVPLRAVVESAASAFAPGSELGAAWARNLSGVTIVPVRGESAVRGTLCIGHGDADGFGVDALNFVDAVATILSTALQRIESEAQLTYLAQFDSLTGLANRALLTDRFSQAIVQARRRHLSLGVLFIDLDEFKIVNDTLGHGAGDELLKGVADRLRSTLRPGDSVARIAGDEFAVLLGELASADDAALVAQKIIAALSEAFELQGQEVLITASVGIATYPADGQDAGALLAAADAAMYRAKQSGRNAYHFFTADLNQRMRARVQRIAELRRALERGEFELHYQPKFNLQQRAVCGAEALLRWKHPVRGMTSPAEFIPLLEESGLIVPVGDWVLETACRELKARIEDGLPGLPIAINVSARQFRQLDLAGRITRLVQSTGIAPELIELEITETQLMQDPEHAGRVLRELRDAGIGLAIDDFGTGYSSLSYLTRFPLSALKVDRSFVATALDDEAAAAIVRTVIDMAHILGFRVIAEGVENEAQAAFLRGLGCDEGQGYLFAKPMPEAQLRQYTATPKLSAAGVRRGRPAARLRRR